MKSRPVAKPRPRRTKKPRKRVALVLGGGGLKGFAHLGVLRALSECGIAPQLYAGTSIGSLIAAAAAGGASLDDMEQRARNLRRRDLFRLNRIGMVLERLQLPAIYLEQPLRDLCESIAPDMTFNDMETTLLVNTVDLRRGTQVVWGLPGLKDVRVADAVYASCALPGFFPPGKVGERPCVDGGVVDNLPVGVASLGMNVVIAVDTGTSAILTDKDVETHGFSAIYMRAATTMMHALQLSPLQDWSGPPMLLIRPKVSHIGWLTFTRTDELIEAGYRAAMEALRGFARIDDFESGIFPRTPVRVTVDREKCIGCTLCVALAPQVMTMDESGKAVPWTPEVEWSPADGEFVHHCPTRAIEATPIGGATATDQSRALEMPGAADNEGAA